MNKLIAYLKDISIDSFVVGIYFLCLPFTVVTTPFGSLLKLITMPVLAVLAYKLIIGERKELRFNGVHFVYSVYIAYTLTGLFMLRSQQAITSTTDMLSAYIAIILISVRVYNEKERALIETAWIGVGIICTYLCLTSTETVNSYENRIIVRVLGFAEDPNQFCAYFIMPVMICMKRIVEKSKIMPFYVVLLLLIMYSVLRTGSRGGLIGILIGIFLCIMLAIRSIKAKIAIILLCVFCAVVVVTVVFPLLPEDVQTRYSVESVVEDGGAGRFDVWKYLIQYAADSPARLIRGSGMWSTTEILGAAKVHDNVGAAHNQFFQVLTDQGVLGLVMFFALICTCFFRNWRREPYYACAFVAVMAFSMSLTLYVFKPYINIIIMCAMNFSVQKERSM